MTTVLVTGSTDGIGKETARQLAAAGARVLLHGRSEERVAAALRDLPGAGGWVCDFSSLGEVRAGAARLPQGLDVLVNNAGLYTRTRQLSQDGYELTFQVNHLAPFLLTNLLLPSMNDGARIVNVSSALHASGALDFDDLMLERRYSGAAAYAQSKLANVLFTRELARRQRKATANALHPGVVATRLLREGFGGFGGVSPGEGAKTPVYLSLSPLVAGVSGKYFVDAREATPSARALDDELARRLWEASARLCGM